MTSGVNILATIQAKGCRTADAFAQDEPYIQYFSFGKYDGGEWQIIHKGNIIKRFDVKPNKEDEQVQFIKAKFWVEIEYYIDRYGCGNIVFSKTPFGTWMENTFTRKRIVEIIGE